MMRFPASTKDPQHCQCLHDIFSAVKEELGRYDLVARRADVKPYDQHRQIWNNLCVYMFGCKYGIAILEDYSSDEFNPNIALEYGFMKALGREVVILEDVRFSHRRADIIATIPESFTIDADDGTATKNSVRSAVRRWAEQHHLKVKNPDPAQT